MSTTLQLEEDISTLLFICDCDEWMRSACASEVFYKERERKRYCVLHYPGSEKIEAFRTALKRKLEAEDLDFRGVWFPEKANFEGVQFSPNVDFHGASFSAGADFWQASFGASANFSDASFNADAHFGGVSFGSDAKFSGASFSANADFTGASFSGDTSFREASFNAHANFKAASFRGRTSFYRASFREEANFYQAMFKADAIFYEASFSADSSFRRVSFSADADFTGSKISAKADFSSATFAGYVRFAGDNDHQVFGKHAYLKLQHARVEKPERGLFHTLRLSPYWFVNVDARKFEFVNVDWSNSLKHLKHEVKTLRPLVSSAPHRLLSIAYRQLAVNAEENHRYGEAADFRYGSMDLRRLEWSRGRKIWKSHPKAAMKTSSRLLRSLWRNKSRYRRTLRRMKLFALAYVKGLHVLHWLYWLASGYGERVTRAIVVLAVLWLVFAGLYTRTGFERKISSNNSAQIEIKAPSDNNTEKTIALQEDEVGKPLPFKRALIYSFAVMSLQKPEPKPLTNAAHSLVILETVLGPIQAALLALAIRRRFMR